MWTSLLSFSLAALYCVNLAEAGVERLLPDIDRDLAPFAGKIGWLINWNSVPPSGLPDGVRFFPMLQTITSEILKTWDQNARDAIAKGSDVLFGFQHMRMACQTNGFTNEADCAPFAALIFDQYLRPLKEEFPTITVVSPAAVSGQDLKPLEDFMSACGGCQIDAIAVEWYGMTPNIADFTAFVETVHRTFNKPVWVTSFEVSEGDTSPPEVKLDFLKQALDFLDRNKEYVHGYATGVNFLIDAGATEPNNYGKTYIGIA